MRPNLKENFETTAHQPNSLSGYRLSNLNSYLEPKILGKGEIMTKDIDIKEIEKDINNYLTKKYGPGIRLVGFGPRPERESEDKDKGDAGEKADEPLPIHFDMKPKELKAYLDEYLVKQDKAKEVLATKICTHYNRVRMFELNQQKNQNESVGEIKNNIIMIGPTGVGKTFLIKLIAKKIGVPFVKGDATKFSETGYVGGDVEDLVRDLVHEANGDIELAQYGIIYLDEVDKIASSTNLIGPDVSRSGVQRALLKPMEETEVELRTLQDPVSQMEAMMEFQKTGKRERKRINTRHILFIMSGAFAGLEEIIKKRLNRQGMGFGAEVKSKDEKTEYLRLVKAEDLIQYGFESEFIGRLPVVTVFENLEVEDLYHILRNPKSPIITSKKKDFKAYGIDLQFEDDALRLIAENAFKERTGARGLVSAVERVLLGSEHVLPSTPIRHLVVTAAMVNDPEAELQKILQNPEDQQREARFRVLLAEEERSLEGSIREKCVEFHEHYGINFSDQRIRLITRRIVEERRDLDSVIDEVLAVCHAARSFEQGFSSRNEVKISLTEEAIDCLMERVWKDEIKVNPEDFLRHAFQNYEHGLKLINKKTGTREFPIPAAGMQDPENYLSELIRESYKD
ncbi:MAG: AAA family ATPase [bacterium]